MLHSWPLRYSGLLILLLCIAAGVFSQKVCPPVEGRPSCVCRDDNGTYISLLSFGGSPEKPSFNVSHGDFNFFLNPCYGVNLIGLESSECSSADGMAGCQRTIKKDYVWGLGKLSTETIYKNTDDTYYVTYTNGEDTRHVKLNLVCIAGDEKDDLSTEGDDGHVLEYIFTLKSHKICPTINLTNSSSFGKGNKNEAIGLGIGVGIISLAIVGILAYVIAGILYNKFALSKTGLDLLPFLIKEGFLFVLSPMMRKVREDYQPLDRGTTE